MKFGIVQPDQIHRYWPEAKPLISKALEHADGEMIAEDVLPYLLEGSQNLWLGSDDAIFLALVTEIIKYPRKKVLRIITFATNTGYDMDKWYHFMDILEDFGLRCGCSSIEAWARKGLAKKLNWDHEYSVITKHIEEDY